MSKQTRKKELESVVVRSQKRAVLGKPPAEPSNTWAIAIFGVVTILFFWGHLFGNSFLWEDFAEFTYPNQVFAARNFISGIIPFWNPYTFNGMPFVADLQIGFFYPLNQLMYLLSGGELGSRLAQMFVVLHYFIAMLGMWKLARTLKIGPWGAIFAGITYGLGGMMVAQMIHPNMVQHFAWFPLIVALFYRGVAERRLSSALLSGVTLGVALLSGHPQSLLFIVFFLLCLTIWLLVADVRSKDPARSSGMITALIAAALPVLVGIGIFAVQLLPSQELAGLSERAEMTYEKSVEGKLAPRQLLTLVTPKVFGVATGDPKQSLQFWQGPERYYFWETVIYIGVVTLLLTGVGLASKRLGGLRWFFGGMALLGLLYALGDGFFIHPLLSKLPLFSTFRIPTRMAIYLAMGGSVLAGAGLERVIGGRKEELADASPRIVLALGGVIVLIGLLTVTGVLTGMLGAPGEIAPKLSGTGIIPLLIGAAATAAAWAGLRQKLPGLGVAIALLLCAAVDLFSFGVDQNASPEDPASIYKSNDAQSVQLKAAPPKDIFRVNMRQGGSMLMQRNQGPYSGIMLYEGYNPLLLSRRVPPAPNQEKAFDLLNMRYGIKIDSVNRTGGLAERTTQYPHARMVYDVKLVAGMDQAKALMKGGSMDFGTTAVVEHAPGSPDMNAPVKTEAGGAGTCTITNYDAGGITVDVTTDKPGVLVLSEIWYPAWHAYLDNAPAELLIADYSLRGVAVPSGRHSVRMKYESPAFANGLWISIGTTILSIAGLIFLWLRERKSK